MVTSGGSPNSGASVSAGRRRDLDRICRAFEAAQAGRPRDRGHRGSRAYGKTAFLRQCAARAQHTVVVEVSCDESEIALGLGVVDQLVTRASEVWQRAPQPGSADSARASPLATGAKLLRMLSRLADVELGTREVVAAAAVARPRCSVRLVGAAHGPSDPFDILDAATAAGLLRWR